jgi:hypothetical protein
MKKVTMRMVRMRNRKKRGSWWRTAVYLPNGPKFPRKIRESVKNIAVHLSLTHLKYPISAEDKLTGQYRSWSAFIANQPVQIMRNLNEQTRR